MKKTGLMLMCLLVAACQAPQNIKELESRNATLESQLDTARQEITTLKSNEIVLKREVDELNRVIDVLSGEKSSRIEESMGLRGEVRAFVQLQVDHLKAFLLDSNLLDYIGGELVQRPKVDDKPLLLVDLENKIPRAGTLTGVGAYFLQQGTFTVKVLRPVEGKLFPVWESAPLQVKETGMQRLSFPVSVGVEQGDLLGYYFPQRGLVSYDTGTGNTRYLREDITLGAGVKESSLLGEDEKRSYSMGVYGLLNTN